MPTSLTAKSLVIFGYGAQGRAQAMNLRDSGLNVTICLPASSSTVTDVKSAGLPLIINPVEAAKKADIAVLLVPDAVQAGLYDDVESSLPKNATLVFAHGLNIHYKRIQPRKDLDVILVAPMSHGNIVRKMYLEKLGPAILVAVQQDATGRAWQTAKEYAAGIGATDGKIIETTFAEETETDLFAEQSLICGGISKLITAAFDTLTDAGYSPEIAYYCCLKEAKIMTDMFADFGIHGTFEQISDTARFGALSRGPRIIDSRVKEQLKKVLDEIRDGSFMREFEEELQKGKYSRTKEMMKVLAEHKIELLHKEGGPL